MAAPPISAAARRPRGPRRRPRRDRVRHGIEPRAQVAVTKVTAVISDRQAMPSMPNRLPRRAVSCFDKPPQAEDEQQPAAR